MGDDGFGACTASFLTWLSQMGVMMSPKMALVDLRSVGRGRGVVALEDFKGDELVFSIPRSAVFNIKTVALAIPSLTPEVLQDMPGWLSLASIMMCESLRDISMWSDYLAVLPEKLDSLVFWSPEELEELQASAVVRKVGKASAEKIFGEKVLALGIRGGSIKKLHQMASIIMAYAFELPKDDLEEPCEDDHAEWLIPEDDNDQRMVLSMVPLADMLNADADLNNARLCFDKDYLEMRTIRPVKKGDEILNDYGPLPRSDLLRRYGYITDGYSKYDVVEISTDSIISALQQNFDSKVVLEPLGVKEVEDRLELARREDVFDESYDISHNGSEGTCFQDELIVLIYLFLIDDDLIDSIKFHTSGLPPRSKMETELLGRVLVAILRRRYQEYGTTIEEDGTILSAGTIPVRKMMAVKVRHGEKVVLQEAMTEATSFQGGNGRMRINSSKRDAEPIPKPPKRGRHT